MVSSTTTELHREIRWIGRRDETWVEIDVTDTEGTVAL